MVENVTKIPVKIQEKAANVPSTTQAWTPFVSLRREMDRLFDDFGRGFWQLPTRSSVFDVEPFWDREMTWEDYPRGRHRRKREGLRAHGRITRDG